MSSSWRSCSATRTTRNRNKRSALPGFNYVRGSFKPTFFSRDVGLMLWIAGLPALRDPGSWKQRNRMETTHLHFCAGFKRTSTATAGLHERGESFGSPPAHSLGHRIIPGEGLRTATLRQAFPRCYVQIVKNTVFPALRLIFFLHGSLRRAIISPFAHLQMCFSAVFTLSHCRQHEYKLLRGIDTNECIQREKAAPGLRPL